MTKKKVNKCYWCVVRVTQFEDGWERMIRRKPKDQLKKMLVVFSIFHQIKRKTWGKKGLCVLIWASSSVMHSNKLSPNCFFFYHLYFHSFLLLPLFFPPLFPPPTKQSFSWKIIFYVIHNGKNNSQWSKA